MALKGGSLVVGATALPLTGAIPGSVLCRALTFNSPVANTQVIAVGGSNVEADGSPAYFTISPGGSFTTPVPGDGLPIEVDFSKLYARAGGAGQTLQIVFID
jgi:hypothetical protein